MVERGHDDAVALDEWVWLMSMAQSADEATIQLGLTDRTEIEWFQWTAHHPWRRAPSTFCIGTFAWPRRWR
jgi:hypothetical protein